MNRTTVGGPKLGGGRGAGGVVVLADPAGAGSGAVAPLLANSLHPSVLLRADDFRRAIRQGFVPSHLPQAHRQNETALAAAIQAAFAFATGGYQVVLEATVAPPALDVLRRESRTTGAPLHYVVLRPSGGPGESDPPDRHDVDVAAEPKATAGTVLAGLGRGAFLLGW
ncbi:MULTISPECIES: hypothetical protein [unclassified Kitasatospora]|uniref:hypothetical protein n=1 Tax=unclassified Kitasatospora TaxID=2633591 RepID=UPI002E35C332|nr:hypothetical protein [Kitasatospora sp. NBC_01246]